MCPVYRELGAFKLVSLDSPPSSEMPCWRHSFRHCQHRTDTRGIICTRTQACEWETNFETVCELHGVGLTCSITKFSGAAFVDLIQMSFTGFAWTRRFCAIWMTSRERTGPNRVKSYLDAAAGYFFAFSAVRAIKLFTTGTIFAELEHSVAILLAAAIWAHTARLALCVTFLCHLRMLKLRFARSPLTCIFQLSIAKSHLARCSDIFLRSKFI